MTKKLLVILISIVLFGFCSDHAFAKTCVCKNDGGTTAEKSCDDCSSDSCKGSDYTSCVEKTTPASPKKLDNPLGEGTTVEVLIGRIIKAILGVVGSLALLMFVYGGLTWMTASGNKEKVEKGKEIIIWATLGLVVIFSSYVLVEFVITSLTS